MYLMHMFKAKLKKTAATLFASLVLWLWLSLGYED